MKTILNFESDREKISKLHDVFTRRSEQKITASNHKSSIKTGLNSYKEKGGLVVRGQTVVIKSNFTLTGLAKKNGEKLTKISVGNHTSQALNYMNNHGNDDIKEDSELSNIYNESGERMERNEFNQMRADLESNGVVGMRRTMISLGHNLERDDYAKIVKESVDEFKDLTDKNFNYKFAIHTDHELPHAHVISYSNSGKDVLINREQMQILKEIVADKTESHFLSKENSIEKEQEIKIQGGMEL